MVLRFNITNGKIIEIEAVSDPTVSANSIWQSSMAEADLLCSPRSVNDYWKKSFVKREEARLGLTSRLVSSHSKG